MLPFPVVESVPSGPRRVVLLRPKPSTRPSRSPFLRHAELDEVADPELVLHQDEEPGEEVSHQALCAEAERHTEDAGPGEKRREVETQPPEHEQGCGPPDHHPYGVGHRVTMVVVRFRSSACVRSGVPSSRRRNRRIQSFPTTETATASPRMIPNRMPYVCSQVARTGSTTPNQGWIADVIRTPDRDRVFVCSSVSKPNPW
jgi:hypothetical protein